MNRTKSRARRSKLAPSSAVNQKNLTVRETAQELNLSEKTLRAWVAARRIGIVRLGRSVRIPRPEIDRVLAEGAVPAVVGR